MQGRNFQQNRELGKHFGVQILNQKRKLDSTANLLKLNASDFVAYPSDFELCNRCNCVLYSA